MRWHLFVRVTAENAQALHEARGIWKMPQRQFKWPDRLAEIMRDVLDQAGELGHVRGLGLVVRFGVHMVEADEAEQLEYRFGGGELPFGLEGFGKLKWTIKPQG